MHMEFLFLSDSCTVRKEIMLACNNEWNSTVCCEEQCIHTCLAYSQTILRYFLQEQCNLSFLLSRYGIVLLPGRQFCCCGGYAPVTNFEKFPTLCNKIILNNHCWDDVICSTKHHTLLAIVRLLQSCWLKGISVIVVSYPRSWALKKNVVSMNSKL